MEDQSPASSMGLIHPDFPAELLLATIQKLPFEYGRNIAALSLTHPRIAAVLRRYEVSIAKSVARNELPHVLYDFPSSSDEKKGYAWLKSCTEKYDAIDDIMEHLTRPVDDRISVGGMRPPNFQLVFAGMLLLYRVASLPSLSSKLEFLNTLPQDSLIAIILAITQSLLTARYVPLLRTVPPSVLHRMDATAYLTHEDIALAFRSASLHHGPDFIRAMLYTPRDTNAETALFNAYLDVAGGGQDVDASEDPWAGLHGSVEQISSFPSASSSSSSSTSQQTGDPIVVGPLKGKQVVAAELGIRPEDVDGDEDPTEAAGSGCCLWNAITQRVAPMLGCESHTVVAAVQDIVEFENHHLAGLSYLHRYVIVGGENIDVS